MQGLRPLYRYFDFNGRSGRAEYWQFTGLVIAAIILALLLDSVIDNLDMPLLTLGVLAATVIPFYAVAARRLHDRGWSARWLVGHAAVSIFGGLLWRAAGANSYTAAGDVLTGAARISDWIIRGFIVFFLYQFTKTGDEGPNAYGAAPHGEEPAPTFGDIAATVRAQMQPSAGGQATPPKSVAKSSNIDPLEQIERLAKLRDAGMLTDEEFQTQKATYLGRL